MVTVTIPATSLCYPRVQTVDVSLGATYTYYYNLAGVLTTTTSAATYAAAVVAGAITISVRAS